MIKGNVGKKRWFILAVMVVALCPAAQRVRAVTIIHESASLGPTGQNVGWYLGNDQFFGSVFHVDYEIQVTAIGGHLIGGAPGKTIFGAILSLQSRYDLPSGSPIDMSEVVAYTTFNPDTPSTDYRVPLSATLQPGYYALVFGTNNLGASSGYVGSIPHPDEQVDLPDALYIKWRGTGWLHAGSHQWQLRFVVEGAASNGYCSASGGGAGVYISGVELASIRNKPTAYDGYAYYPMVDTIMYIGNDYPLTVTAVGSGSHQCAAWIDWNQDGDFDEPDETISMSGSPGSGPYTATVTPPEGIPQGNTGMRVRIWDSGSSGPCGWESSGEVEDYIVTIGPGSTGYGGGSGTPDDPYLIFEPWHMNAIGQSPGDWHKYFKMTADIDLSTYSGIGGYPVFNIIEWFTGFFDGNGHTISNFTYTAPDETWPVGLFGEVGDFSTYGGGYTVVKDLGLIDPNINAGTSIAVGALAGWKFSGDITGCYVTGGSVSGGGDSGYFSGVGGLVGLNEYGNIISCSSACNVSGNNNVGGLVGGNVEAGIMDSYSTSTVSGNDYVGGLTGSSGWVSDCYSAGAVSGIGDNVGGFTGDGWPSEEYPSNSFWDTQASGQPTSPIATPKTTEEMQDPNTFVSAGWDFVGQPDGPSDIWAMPPGGGYPILWWQLWPLPPLPAFAGGSGEPGDPYLIATAAQLNSIGYNPRLMSAHFKLIDDIDLAGVNFFIIGSDLYPFDGTFDGNGHRVSNFTHNTTGISNIGFFSFVGEGGEIKDLSLIDPNVTAHAGSNVGALIGRLGPETTISGCNIEGGTVSGGSGEYDDNIGGLIGLSYGTIIDCFTSSAVFGNADNVGGLVGFNGGDIAESCATGNVFGSDDRVGGLVGYNGREMIQSSCATGDVFGADDNVGGLVGINFGDIENCYAMGDVSGDDQVGGLIGYNIGFDSEGVSKCYSTGSVSGDADVGGFVGRNTDRIDNSFWDTDTSGRTNMCGRQDYGGTGCSGANGMTTTEMYDPNTFLDAGWDFVGESVNGSNDIWRMCVDGFEYPKLDWEFEVGDFLCPDGVYVEDLVYLAERWLEKGLTPYTSADLTGDGQVALDDFGVVARNWFVGIPLFLNLSLDNQWMYQNLPGQSNSDLTAAVSIAYDPLNNSSYTYDWEFILPDDVTIAPTITAGGETTDPCCTFAAPSCNEPNGISDSGQTFTVRVTVTGANFGNSAQAEAPFGIALLGDVNNDTEVNVDDQDIINDFWQTGSAGDFTLRDCDLNYDDVVNVADRNIANAIWQGVLGQNWVTTPCPLR